MDAWNFILFIPKMLPKRYIVIFSSCLHSCTNTGFYLSFIFFHYDTYNSILGLPYKVLQTECLKQRKFIVLQFWRPDIQDQDQRGWFFLKALKNNLLYASPLDSGGLIAIFRIPWVIKASSPSLHSCSHSILPVHVCVQIPPSN